MVSKADIVETIAAASDISKAAAERACNAFIDAVVEGVNKDGAVTIVGFGTFKKTERKARKGRNPQTGAEIDIPASTTITFKAGKKAKEAVS